MLSLTAITVAKKKTKKPEVRGLCNFFELRRVIAALFLSPLKPNR